MENTEEHNDNQENIRRLLKELPKVQASPDFEQRLQRRISHETTPGWLERFFRPARIPAFAYSLTTVVVVGIISYYAFFRPGTAPRPELPPVQDSLKIAAQSEPAPSAEGRVTDNRVDKTEPPEMTPPPEANMPPQPSLSARTQKDLRDKSVSEQDERDRENDAAGDLKADKSAERQLQQFRTAAPPPVVQKEEQANVQLGIVAEKESLAEERDLAAKVLSSRPQTLRKSAESAFLMSADEVGLDQQLKFIARQIDSLQSRDSVKLDSLRRVQRFLQLQQQKAKIRKPSGED